MSKPNWACSACGMYSGRKESVVRHIRNKNVHNGYASVIPFVDSLIARRSGFYAGQYEGRKNHVRHPNTGFELFQKILPEKMAEKMAEKWVSTSPQFQLQPSYPQPLTYNHLGNFFADAENLFAIEASICNLAIEPVKILYAESHRPVKIIFCSHPNPSTGFQQEQDFPQYGFVSSLKSWVDYALSTIKQKKLLRFAFLRPSRKTVFP